MLEPPSPDCTQAPPPKLLIERSRNHQIVHKIKTSIRPRESATLLKRQGHLYLESGQKYRYQAIIFSQKRTGSRSSSITREGFFALFLDSKIDTIKGTPLKQVADNTPGKNREQAPHSSHSPPTAANESHAGLDARLKNG
jgi:hypothetical protein